MKDHHAKQAVSRPKKYGTAESRWAGIGPYYAMFPTAFADEIIRKHTRPGDAVLDPFAGRGTAVFSAATQNRHATGIEINPVGYVYATAKLKPGGHTAVARRLQELAETAQGYQEAADNLTPFFHYCFAPKVRTFLVAARDTLNWRRSKTDRTLMAIILISLHGKIGRSLSNQMRQSTAMAPDYCIRWWTEKNLTPPDIDPIAFIAKRLKWRYAHGIPPIGEATMFLHDSVRKLPTLTGEVLECQRQRVKLLLTSPPYHNVTNYYHDQWLRLWLLGDPEHPSAHGSRYGGKFSNYAQYRQLLKQVFERAKPILAEDAIIYIRTDQRRSTLESTRTILSETFPDKRITEKPRPLNSERQTQPYSRGGAPKKAHCEIDIVLEPR